MTGGRGSAERRGLPRDRSGPLTRRAGAWKRPPSTRRLPTALGGLLLPFLLLLLPACDFDSEPGSQLGRVAPAYEAPTMEGDLVSLDDLRGQVVLLNMWATWCPPCRWEMPHLQALHEELRDQGLAVVGVSVDSSGSDRQVRQFLDELGIDFLILRDPAERGHRLFGGYGLPMTVLIDGEGVVRWRHMGPVTSDDPGLREVLSETLGALAAG